MQNNIKLAVNWPKMEPDDLVEMTASALESIGFEVNREKKDYIMLRFRRDSRQWSHIHYRERGLPWFLVVSGPEMAAATQKGFKKAKERTTKG